MDKANRRLSPSACPPLKAQQREMSLPAPAVTALEAVSMRPGLSPADPCNQTLRQIAKQI